MSVAGHPYKGLHSFNKDSILRFYDGDESHYVGLKAPSSVTSSLDYTLPSAGPAANDYVLVSDTSGNLSWAEQTGGSGSCSGVVPIGAVVALFADITGVPALADNFVRCDGQIVSDVDSPINGQRLPNLNNYPIDGSHASGFNAFLRGAQTTFPTGGTTGGASTHTHAVNTNSMCSGSNSANTYVTGVQSGSSLPPYFDVIWVIRIK